MICYPSLKGRVPVQYALWGVSAIAAALLVLVVILAVRSKKLNSMLLKLEHIAALIDSAPYYIAYDDEDSSDLYANPAACRMVGRPVNKPLVKNEVHDDEGVRILKEEAFPAVEKHGEWVGENRILHTDGHLIDVQQFVFTVKDKSGKVIGMGTLMRDITEEKAMRREIDIQSSIINSSGNFILALDTNMKIVYASPGVYEMSGYSRDEIGLDFTPALFHRPETVEEVFQKRAAALDEDIFEIESEFIRKDGSEFDVLHRFFTIKDKSGNVIGAGGILSDISEFKRTQNELMAAKEAAEDASRAKSLFLSNMSHEIRTPLNAIIGMSHIIKKSASDEKKVLASVNEVMAASDHLLGLLNNILDMAKIESGKFNLACDPFSLKPALDEVINIFTQHCDKKEITLITEIDNLPECALKGDKLRIKQILINLLGNAVKFTNSGGTVKLAVSEKKTNNGSLLNVAVSDTGIGMSEEEIPRLFSAFNQGGGTVSAQYGGTGLGLAISQNLVKQMGGIIDVKSELGHGTVFSFSVELPVAEEMTDENSNRPAETPDLSGKRILLAEDIEINRVIVAELLSKTNVTIDEAKDGLEAVGMFERSPDRYYDLIFMDVQMPNMDGYEATEKIRSLPRADASVIPIVAMTANAYREDVEKAIGTGMTYHLSKPVNVDTMFKLLSQLRLGEFEHNASLD